MAKQGNARGSNPSGRGSGGRDGAGRDGSARAGREPGAAEPSEPTGRERRRHERTELKIPVDYSSVDAFFSEFSENINEGGMFVEMEQPAALETPVQLQFCLPGEPQPLRVEGRVAWVRQSKPDEPAGVGIEFHNLTQETRDTINRIVRQLRQSREGRKPPR